MRSRLRINGMASVPTSYPDRTSGCRVIFYFQIIGRKKQPGLKPIPRDLGFVRLIPSPRLRRDAATQRSPRAIYRHTECASHFKKKNT